jgi:hypothetical protein
VSEETDGEGEPPIVCSLDASAVPGRLDAWQAALVHVAEREAIDGGVRLVLTPDAPIGEVAALAAAEQDCCTFFAFTLTVDGRGTALEVRAPMAARDLVTSLFGPAAGPIPVAAPTRQPS